MRYPNHFTNQTIINLFLQEIFSKIPCDEKKYAIDATAGQGYDTAFLAKLVGEEGMVWAFDVQEEALSITRERLIKEELQNRVKLINRSHEFITEEIPQEVVGSLAVIIYNLGFLPGSNKQVATNSDSTISSLQQAIKMLRRNGVVIITVYPGHDGGAQEAQSVEEWVALLDSKKYYVTMYLNKNRKFSAPQVYFIEQVMCD